MSEMGEMFNDLRKDRQEKRAHNRDASAQYLKDRGIPFDSKSGGAHLMIPNAGSWVNFWPGTGLWQVAIGGKKGRGVKSLCKFLGK